MVRRTRKRIEWKKSPAERVPEERRLPPIIRIKSREDELVLIPGQLFRLKYPLELMQENHRFQKPPVPYATEAYYKNQFPTGSYAIFLGHTRLEEMDGTHVRSLLRATFMVNGTKLLPTDLNCLELVS